MEKNALGGAVITSSPKSPLPVAMFGGHRGVMPNKHHPHTDMKTISNRNLYPYLGNDLDVVSCLEGQVKMALHPKKYRKFIIVKVESESEDEAAYELQCWIQDPNNRCWEEVWYCGCELRKDALEERKRLIELGKVEGLKETLYW